MSLGSQYGKKLDYTKEDLFTRVNNLTSNQMEIYMLLLEGCSQEEMTRQIGISPQLLSDYQSEIFNKLGVHSTAELIIHYREIL